MTTPVLLTFDMDAEQLWLARDADSANKPVWLSQGTYGPNVGLPRILALLERYDVACTFFVPGKVIENHPAAIESILEAGIEIEHHSYTHKWAGDLGPDAELEEFQLGYDAIVTATGRKPQGWRSPAAELTPDSIRFVEQFGMTYSSNMFDSDTAYLLSDAGRQTDIVELPFAWVNDDAPFFMYSNKLPGRNMSAPSAVVESWTREFDGLIGEPGTHYLLAGHPQVIGRPSRLWALEQTLLHIVESGEGEFVTCAAYADRVRPALLAARAAGTPS
jgi:peptidoglycan-N-acetylglucosamine deacetylase